MEAQMETLSGQVNEAFAPKAKGSTKSAVKAYPSSFNKIPSCPKAIRNSWISSGHPHPHPHSRSRR